MEHFVFLPDQESFKTYVENYLKSEVPSPLVVLSKPFSGRTTTIKEVVRSMDIPMKDVSMRHWHSAPSGFDKNSFYNKGRNYSFDEWFKEEYARFNEEDKKFCFIEIDPDLMVMLPDYRFRTIVNDYCKPIDVAQYYNSTLCQIVFYLPSVDDWIKWAKNSEYILPETISFAEKYKDFYSFDHNIFNRLDGELSKCKDELDLYKKIEAGSELSERDRRYLGFIHDSVEKVYTTAWVESNYKRFYNALSGQYLKQPISDLFICFLKSTWYKCLFEVKR